MLIANGDDRSLAGCERRRRRRRRRAPARTALRQPRRQLLLLRGPPAATRTHPSYCSEPKPTTPETVGESQPALITASSISHRLCRRAATAARSASSCSRRVCCCSRMMASAARVSSRCIAEICEGRVISADRDRGLSHHTDRAANLRRDGGESQSTQAASSRSPPRTHIMTV
jgi:hypothetical protein